MDDGGSTGAGVGAPEWRPDPPVVEPWHHSPERGTGRAWARSHPGAVSASVLVAVLLVVGVATAAARLDGPPAMKKVPPNQAGYLWCCGAHEVSAQWVVPRLARTHQVGAEAVWIGEQTGTGSFFLQVGSNEYVSPLTSEYEAFWSDGPLHGMPQNLGALAPGDRVRARLAHLARRWVVTFADLSQGWSRTVRLGYHASDVEAIAEWIEEDPVSVDPVRGQSLFHMARTAGTRIADLLVNGAPPERMLTTPESFTDAAGTTFRPTALRHDDFGFRPW